MELLFTCSSCGKRLKVKGTAMGTQVGCPGCGSSLAVPRDEFSPGTRIAGFEIVRPLGKGGMGEVYLARQLAMGREVALKVLSAEFAAKPGARERFLKEVHVAAKLEHSNIVTAHDAGEDDGLCYMAMSFVPGQSLAALLRPGAVLEERDALEMTLKLAQALDYAWSTFHIIHRDIKPANILFDAKGEPKLADMGLSKSLDDAEALTMSGTVMGTPNYMSPEQAEGRGDIDFRADIYSLGATLYHAVTGQMPFAGSSIMAVLRKQAVEILPDPRQFVPEISEHFVGLLQIMLAKNRDDRYADWKALIRDIRFVLDAKPPSVAVPAAGGSVLLRKDKPAAPAARAAHKRIVIPKGGVHGEKPAPAPAPAPSKAKPDAAKLKRIALIGGAVTAAILVVAVAVKMGTGGGGRGKTEPPRAPTLVPSPSDPFAREIASLPPGEQVFRVAKRLKELNPGYDGKIGYKSEAAMLKIADPAATDLTPLSALPWLKELACDPAALAKTANQSVLRSMPALATINGAPAAEFWKKSEAPTRPPPVRAPEDRDWITLPNGWRVGRTPKLLDGMNISTYERAPFLSADGLQLFFFAGGRGETNAVYFSRRSHVGGRWGPRLRFGPPMDDRWAQRTPCMSADGLTLIFASDQPGGSGDMDLWMCRRSGPEDFWAPAVNLGPLVNSDRVEGRCCLSADGLSLFFGSTREGGEGGSDLWVCSRRRTDESWGAPVNLGAVNGIGDEMGPSVSADGLIMVFQSVADGFKHLRMSTRRNVGEPFGKPIDLGPEINKMKDSGEPSLSADGRTLLFSDDRLSGPLGRDIWQVALLPPETSVAPPPPEVVPPAAAPANTIDLLPLIDPAKDAVTGTWTRANGTLSVDAAKGARLEIPYLPPEEYDFSVTCRMESGGPESGQILSVRGQNFAWKMGAYTQRVCCLDVVGPQRDRDYRNKSTLFPDAPILAGAGGPFRVPVAVQMKPPSGTVFTSTVQVRRDEVRAYIDDRLILRHKTDYSDMSLEPLWTLRTPGALGLYSHGTRTVYQRIQVREVTGKGKFTRGAPATAPAPPVAAAGSGWVPLDISAACNRDVISTATRTSADRMTYNGGTLASASWQRQMGYPEPGLPDDGRVPIPDAPATGFFQVRMSPARNAILLSAPEGSQPQPITVELADSDRRRYSELAILHATCWGDGTLNVSLRYETGPDASIAVPVYDWFSQGRDPLQAGIRVAVRTHDTHPTGGRPADMLAQRIPVDPARVLRSVTFSFGSFAPSRGRPEHQETRSRFTIGVFAVSALPAAADDPWSGAIDLLPLIEPQQDAVTGEWAVVNGALTVRAGHFPRIQIPYRPPAEYDYRLVFSRQTGADAVWQILVGGGRAFDWVLESTAKGGKKVCGFECIANHFAFESPHNAPMPEPLENGRHYTSVVQVRRNGVKAFLNDRLVAEWQTDYQDLRLPGELRLPDARCLGLGANNSSMTFHRIGVREVDGKGTFTRGAPAAPPAASAAAPAIDDFARRVIEARGRTGEVVRCSPEGGNGLQSYAEALKRLKPGMILRLSAGEYPGTPLVVHGITIEGEGFIAGEIVLSAAGCVVRQVPSLHRLTFRSSAATGGLVVVDSMVNNFTVEGEGQSLVFNCFVFNAFVRQGASAWLRHCSFRRNADIVALSQARELQIEDSVIWNPEEHAFRLWAEGANEVPQVRLAITRSIVASSVGLGVRSFGTPPKRVSVPFPEGRDRDLIRMEACSTNPPAVIPRFGPDRYVLRSDSPGKGIAAGGRDPGALLDEQGNILPLDPVPPPPPAR